MSLNKNSIGFKLWKYFFLFAAIIFSLLWLLQVVFLQSFYESMKVSEIKNLANTIAEDYGNEGFISALDQITFKNSILVYVIDTEGNLIYSSDEHGSGGPASAKPNSNANGPGTIRSLPSDINDFLEKIMQSQNGQISYVVDKEQMQGESIVYGIMLEDAVLYISATLRPVDSTTKILTRQLGYVTLVSLLLSIVIAFLIARKISKPITALSKQANELARGDYNVKFDKGFSSELNELASTLDHAAREMSKVETLRRDFLANISHDLRTPLTMIRSYTEMIRDISGDDKEKREKHLTIIAEETTRLASLVDDILELSVIQSGAGEMKLEDVSLSDLTGKALLHFTLLAELEGVSISADIEHGLYVLADEKRLEQVLYNLIGNAINHAGKDNMIEIALKDFGEIVRFEVRDNGDGIAEHDLPYIWDKYYKAQERKSGKAGAGLGLSIVKGILETHNAKFGVMSSIGSGSTFWFEMKK